MTRAWTGCEYIDAGEQATRAQRCTSRAEVDARRVGGRSGLVVVIADAGLLIEGDNRDRIAGLRSRLAVLS